MRTHEERGGGQIGLIFGAVLIAGAIAAAGFVMMGRQQTEGAKQAIGAVDQANDASAEVSLTNAIRGAEVYFAEQQTFVGYTPEVAHRYDPSITYTAGTAVPGQVSIRGVTPTSLVLVTSSQSGSSLCTAATGTSISYGHQDATDAAGCTGGW